MSSGKDQKTELRKVHLDIIQTDELERLDTLDKIEDKLDMASGSLQFAMDNTNHKAFYKSINEHINQALLMLQKLR